MADKTAAVATATAAEPAAAAAAVAVNNEPLLVTLRANPVFTRLQSLAMWERVLHTSLVVWIVNVFVFLVSYGEYTVATLLGYLLSIFVLLCGGAVLFTAARNHFRKQNNPNPIAARFASGQIGVSRQTVGHTLEIVMLLWNAFIEQARDIVCFERPLRSLKWVLVLYLLGLLGNCLSGIAVLYLLFCFAFTWPRLYREKHVIIDAQWAKVSTQFNALYNKAVAKIPPNVRQHLKLD